MRNVRNVKIKDLTPNVNKMVAVLIFPIFLLKIIREVHDAYTG